MGNGVVTTFFTKASDIVFKIRIIKLHLFSIFTQYYI